MITYRLREPIKGSELIEKIKKAFEEVANKEKRTIIKRGLFKHKEIEENRYFFQTVSQQEFVTGDSGPKVIEKSIRFYFGYRNSAYEHSDRGFGIDKIEFEVDPNTTLDSLTLNCFSYHSINSYSYYNAMESQEINGLSKKDVLETAVSTIFHALYGDKELKDKGTGKVVY